MHTENKRENLVLPFSSENHTLLQYITTVFYLSTGVDWRPVREKLPSCCDQQLFNFTLSAIILANNKSLWVVARSIIASSNWWTTLPCNTNEMNDLNCPVKFASRWDLCFRMRYSRVYALQVLGSIMTLTTWRMFSPYSNSYAVQKQEALSAKINHAQHLPFFKHL